MVATAGPVQTNLTPTLPIAEPADNKDLIILIAKFAIPIIALASFFFLPANMAFVITAVVTIGALVYNKKDAVTPPQVSPPEASTNNSQEARPEPTPRTQSKPLAKQSAREKSAEASTRKSQELRPQSTPHMQPEYTLQPLSTKAPQWEQDDDSYPPVAFTNNMRLGSSPSVVPSSKPSYLNLTEVELGNIPFCQPTVTVVFKTMDDMADFRLKHDAKFTVAFNLGDNDSPCRPSIHIFWTDMSNPNNKTADILNTLKGIFGEAVVKEKCQIPQYFDKKHLPDWMRK